MLTRVDGARSGHQFSTMKDKGLGPKSPNPLILLVLLRGIEPPTY